MNRKTKKLNHWFKKFLCTTLVLAMTIPNTVFTQAANADIPAVTSATENELKAKTNPILKSYKVSDQNGTWAVSSGTRFIVEATNENLANDRLAEVVKLVNAEFVEKEIVSTNPLAMVYGSGAALTPQDILICLADVSDITEETTSEEAYKITIGENGVIVEAASENAVLYALRTIETMMLTNNSLPFGTIIDYPDLAERRLHVDCGRKYFSKDWFIRQIRELSYLKMNTIQMQFSENLGFRVECETDPQIVSDEYLTKDDVREILAEAKKYGVKVIPVLNTPGHVQHILKYHPEYGQVDIYGQHSETALDITNPEAVAYIYSLLDEYMELFEGCSDFHIGADEYMEYDRYPFTSIYKPVLDAYAVEKYGAGNTWREAMAGYTNDIAAYVYEKGFKPRIYNDGVYYNEGSSSQQKFNMHDYIGIDYWSRTSWIGGSPSLETFIGRGHKEIYNFNSSFFYYVLRNGPQSDGRPANSFDVKEQYKNIYNNWTPGQFSGSTIADDSEIISGAALGIWCDYPDIVSEDVVHEDIAKELRALASKSWNTKSSSILSYDAFAALTEELGNAAGYEKGSTLPDAGEFLTSDNLGKVTLKYVDTDGTSLKNDTILYGVIDDVYQIEPAAIYGYRFVSMDQDTEGIYTKEETVITLTYELYTDRYPLYDALMEEKEEANYIPATYAEYKAAVKEAKTTYNNPKAGQTEVDTVLNALLEAESKLISLDHLDLYLEVTYPVSSAGYTTGSYKDYQDALNAAKTVLADAKTAEEDAKKALTDLLNAKEGLTAVAKDGFITVTSTDPTYYISSSYAHASMFDNNMNSFTWLSDAQNPGDEVKFTFASPVKLNSFRYQAPSGAEDDIFTDAVVEISADGQNWTQIGTLKHELDKTIDANGETIQYVRIRIETESEYWVKIAEVSFDYEEAPLDKTVLDDAIASASELKKENYTKASWAVLEGALAKAEKVKENENAHANEITAAVAAIEGAVDALVEPSADDDIVINPPTDPVPTPGPKNPFDDVEEGQYYYDPVLWAVEKGVTSGLNATTFGVGNACTREQIVTFLWNYAGKPAAAQTTCTFKDVNKDHYYYNAMLWANEKGYVSGYNKDTFGVGDPCTREQIVMILWKAAGSKNPISSSPSTAFADVNPNHYYYTALLWAAENRIVSGYSDVKFGVGDACTREQIVTFLYRYAAYDTVE